MRFDDATSDLTHSIVDTCVFTRFHVFPRVSKRPNAFLLAFIRAHVLSHVPQRLRAFPRISAHVTTSTSSRKAYRANMSFHTYPSASTRFHARPSFSTRLKASQKCPSVSELIAYPNVPIFYNASSPFSTKSQSFPLSPKRFDSFSQVS